MAELGVNKSRVDELKTSQNKLQEEGKVRDMMKEDERSSTYISLTSSLLTDWCDGSLR